MKKKVFRKNIFSYFVNRLCDIRAKYEGISRVSGRKFQGRTKKIPNSVGFVLEVGQSLLYGCRRQRAMAAAAKGLRIWSGKCPKPLKFCARECISDSSFGRIGLKIANRYYHKNIHGRNFLFFEKNRC